MRTSLPDSTASPFQSRRRDPVGPPRHAERDVAPPRIDSYCWNRKSRFAGAVLDCDEPPQYRMPPDPGTPQSPKFWLYSLELTMASTTDGSPWFLARCVRLLSPPGSGWRPRM